MLSLQSPEDICNAALVRIGWKGATIGSLYEGSDASKRALDIYGQTRDEMLRSHDWGFAERNVVMTLLKTAPPGGYNPALPWSAVYPILPWRYEYSYPGDALKVRSVRPSPFLIPDFDPRPWPWRVANDPTLADPADPGMGQQVILCDLVNAVLVYTGQVADPLDWEPGFTEALCAALGRRLAPALADINVAKIEAGDEIAAGQMAEKQG